MVGIFAKQFRKKRTVLGSIVFLGLVFFRFFVLADSFVSINPGGLPQKDASMHIPYVGEVTSITVQTPDHRELIGYPQNKVVIIYLGEAPIGTYHLSFEGDFSSFGPITVMGQTFNTTTTSFPLIESEKFGLTGITEETITTSKITVRETPETGGIDTKPQTERDNPTEDPLETNEAITKISSDYPTMGSSIQSSPKVGESSQETLLSSVEPAIESTFPFPALKNQEEKGLWETTDISLVARKKSNSDFTRLSWKKAVRFFRKIPSYPSTVKLFLFGLCITLGRISGYIWDNQENRLNKEKNINREI